MEEAWCPAVVGGMPQANCVGFVTSRAIEIALLGVLMMSALVAVGCLGTFSLAPDGGDAVSTFNATVAPILSSSCGACHGHVGGIGPAFLEPKPDMLTTLLAWPGLVGLTPETSRIYAKGMHEGPALSADQAPIVSSWIKQYNAEKSQGDGG